MSLDKFNNYAEQVREKISGVLGVNFVGIATGNLLYSKTFSSFDYEATAQYEAGIVKNALQEIQYLDNSSKISVLQEVIITNKEQVHIVYISKNQDYLIHLITDATKANYGLLRIVHNQCSTQLTDIEIPVNKVEPKTEPIITEPVVVAEPVTQPQPEKVATTIVNEEHKSVYFPPIEEVIEIETEPEPIEVEATSPVLEEESNETSPQRVNHFRKLFFS